MDHVSITLDNNNEEKIPLLQNQNQPPKLSRKIQFAFGVGHVLNDIYSALWLSYFIVYLTKVRGLSDREAGYLILLGQVADAIANVIIGKLSDKNINLTIFKKYGQRKTWHALGVIVNIMAIAVIFSPCPLSDHNLILLYFSVCIIVFQFAWAAVQITHLALIPEITPDENTRTKLGATRQLFTVLSSILVYATSWVAFGVNAENMAFNPKYIVRFGYIALFGSFVGLICSIIFHVIIKENRHVEEEVIEQKAIGIRSIFCNVRCWQTIIVYMFSMLFVNSCQVLIPPFLSDTLGMDATKLAIVPLIMYTASGITSLGLALTKRKCERKPTYAIGTVTGLSAIMWIGIRWDSVNFGDNELYVVVIFIGIATATVTVTILGLTADLIGTNTDSSALIYSIMTVSDKMINGIAVYIIQHFHQNTPSITYYKDVIACGSGFALMLASITISTIREDKKKPEREDYIPLD